MFEMLRHSHWFRRSVAVLQAFLAVLLAVNPAQAITVACAKTTAAKLSHNGIVAPGAAGPCGAVGPVWPTVAPLEMVPNGSTPNGYLYLAYNPNPNLDGVQHLFIGVDSSGDPDVSNNDDIVVVFHSTSGVDFGPGDFYIHVPVIASKADIATGVACQQPAGPIDYYTFIQGTGWQQVADPAVAAAINAQAAYRYDLNNQVWNLEIDMPISVTINGTKYFDLPATVNPDPTKRVFGLGAYYFISQGTPPVGLNPKPLKWPDTMPDRQSYTDQDMASLATPLSANQLGNVSLSNVCFDVSFKVATPWDIGGVAANESDHKIIRGQVNTFGVTFLYSGPGTVPGNLANSGTVNLSLVPYGAWSNQAKVPWVQAQAVNVPTFNQSTRVTFNYDFGSMPGNWGPFQPLSFVCATATLDGFLHDDDKTDNSVNINYNYFTTSDYTHHFYVSGDDVGNLKAGETGSIYLRLQSNNEPPSAGNLFASGRPTLSRWSWASLLLLLSILFAIVLLIVARRNRLRPAVLASGFTMTLVAMSVLVYVGCRKPHEPKSRWEVQNARQLGLKRVKGHPDLYRMPIKAGELKQVDLKFTGKRLPYTPVRQKLVPASGEGQPNILRIPVQPGRVITVMGFGNIRLDGANGKLPPASPMGIIVGESEPTTTGARSDYLLRSTYYVPNQYAGALIGSFDSFETGFVVGRSSSILVPPEAGTLSLAVNAVLGQYGRIAGDYNLVIIHTEAPRVPTHTAIQGDATGHIPIMFPIWKVLTSLEVHSYFETHGVGPLGRPYQVLNPIGNAYYSIYDSHVGLVP